MKIFTINAQGEKSSASIETFTFSGGEAQLKLNPADFKLCQKVEIFHRLTSSHAVMQLILSVDAINRIGIKSENIELTIPYFPYARQDRVCVAGEAFSAKVMAQLINNLNCAKVTIWDAHSEVTTALVNNVNNVEQLTFVKQSPVLMQQLAAGQFTLVSPDAGASKKSEKIAEAFQGKVELIQALKKRDLATGKILSNRILGEVKDKNILITDDICDGGRTFIELAKTLK